MRVGSLFAGIGGFDLGFERCGMQTVWQVEQSEFCRAVLARHFPDAERFEDVRDVGAHNLAPVDLICGGFPCQDISLAGKGAGIDGSRSGLWSEYARIVRELEPRWVIVENVPALTSRGLDRVLRDLAAIGYDAEWDCLPASAFGAPHRRDRIWVVAYPGCERGERGRGTDDVVRPAGAPESDGEQRQRGGSAPVDRGSGRPGVSDLHPNPDGQRCSVIGELDGDPQAGEQASPRHHAHGLRADVAHSPELGRERGRGARGGRGRPENGGRQGGGSPTDSNHAGCGEQRRAESGEAQQPTPELGGRWPAEPPVDRVVDGFPGRVDQVRALGNALVPQIAEFLGRRILDYEQSMNPQTQLEEARP